MTTKSAVAGLGLVVLALCACKDKKGDATPAPSAAVAATAAAPSPEATAAAVPTEQKPDVNAKGIPAIPAGRSNPPSSAEWSAAPTVNTQEVNSQAKDCSMKIVREWIKVNCEGDIKSISDKDGIPKSSADYFESIQLGKFADFVFRLKKGGMKMRIHRDGNRASLFINWPPSSDRPVNVALAEIKE